MAVQLNRLTARSVNAAKPGLHNDGGGLCLQVSKTGAKSWIYRYKLTDPETGRQSIKSMGLGSAATVSLVEARELAAKARNLRTSGADPLMQKRLDREAAAEAQRQAEKERAARITFAEVADLLIDKQSKRLGNEKHLEQWKTTLGAKPIDAGKSKLEADTLAEHVAALAALRSKPIADVTAKDVQDVLAPVWMVTPETANRTRARIAAVLDYALAMEWRTAPNVASWKGRLEHILPRQTRGEAHHDALPWQEAPTFWAKLIDMRTRSISNIALRFAILTAARTGEVLGARWDEVDEAAKVWAIPADRMKAGKLHRVPLSDAALECLAEVRRFRHAKTDYLFPGTKAGRPLSNMALLQVLRRMEVDATSHGFRSTFRVWVAEATTYPRELAELSLAHVVGSAVERAYQRSDMLEKRRSVMDEWAKFVTTPKACEISGE